MTRKTIIQKTVTALSKLPEDRAKEIADFADHILKKYKAELLKKKKLGKLVEEKKNIEKNHKAKDFVNKWTGFLLSSDAENSKYEYLMSKYK